MSWPKLDASFWWFVWESRIILLNVVRQSRNNYTTWGLIRNFLNDMEHLWRAVIAYLHVYLAIPLASVAFSHILAPNFSMEINHTPFHLHRLIVYEWKILHIFYYNTVLEEDPLRMGRLCCRVLKLPKLTYNASALAHLQSLFLRVFSFLTMQKISDKTESLYQGWELMVVKF